MLLSAPAYPVFGTVEEAVASLEHRFGPCSKRWGYHDDHGDPMGLILRWDEPGGKKIRPVSRTAGGWVQAGMDTPRPLYRLVELRQRRDERVYVVEGEKAADAATGLGLLATTSPHGSGSARQADWTPLAGRDVVILPDNDDAGRRYAEDVTAILRGLVPPAQVRVAALPELGPGGDIYDWIEQHDGVESPVLRERLEKLVAAASEGPEAGGGRREDCPSGLPPAACGPSSSPILTCLADVEETEVRWLWPGRVALGASPCWSAGRARASPSSRPTWPHGSRAACPGRMARPVPQAPSC